MDHLDSSRDGFDRNETNLPLGEKVLEKPVHSLLEVKVTVDVKVPHFARHLDEEVHHARE
jgi:hypothetical protein